MVLNAAKEIGVHQLGTSTFSNRKICVQQLIKVLSKTDLGKYQNSMGNGWHREISTCI